MKPVFRADSSIEKKFHFENDYWENPHVHESIALYQVGDLCSERDFIIKEHEQICYEISYIVSGKGLFYCDGNTYPVKEGDIIINLPKQIHGGKADSSDPFRYFYVGFNFNYVDDNLNPFTYIKKMFDKIKYPVVEDKMEIQIPFQSIFNELVHGKDYLNLIIKTCLHQIIVYAYRDFFDYWENKYIPEKDVADKRNIVYRIINYIDTHSYNISDLTQIASQLGYSYSYLSHLFSSETGLTMLDYFNKKKFEKSVEWIKNDDFSITEIAERLGYQSIHSFSKAFKKIFGVSPTQYQELINKAKIE